MSYLDHIRFCNRHDLSHFRPFLIDGRRVGWVPHGFADLLAAFPEAFRVTPDDVTPAAGLDTPASRSAAAEAALRSLTADGHIRAWRHEPYPVAEHHASPHAGGEVLMQIERAAAPHFGVRAYGEHMTGYVRKADGIQVWVARRAHDKPTYPGMLDNTVAGGQPLGISVRENLIKECWEEAGIPRPLAEQAVPVGAVTYTYEGDGGLKPDLQYCYDLEMPEDFVPRNTDGEMAGFSLMPATEVMEITADSRDFKFNCAVANIDFFIRHGLLTADSPDYERIVAGLRR